MTRPSALDGTFEMLLHGTDGQRMFDDTTVDELGVVAAVDPTLFDDALTSPTFMTTDEDGIIAASDILGLGCLSKAMHVRRASSDEALAEGVSCSSSTTPKRRSDRREEAPSRASVCFVVPPANI